MRNNKVELRKGEAVGLLGANGAGKTTLFKASSGFLPHESGSVTMAGGEQQISAQGVATELERGHAHLAREYYL